jgi:hypothetical protein
MPSPEGKPLNIDPRTLRITLEHRVSGVKTPEPTQPEQAELDRREHRRAYKRDWMRRWRKEHPDQNREINNRWLKSERGKEYRRNYMRGYFARKKEAARASGQTEQQAAEQSGNLPPLHPIFERLSQALAKPQTPVEQDRPESPTADSPRGRRRRLNP